MMVFSRLKLGLSQTSDLIDSCENPASSSSLLSCSIRHMCSTEDFNDSGGERKRQSLYNYCEIVN